MKLEDLRADMEKGDYTYRGVCHDCGIMVSITAKLREDGAIIVAGGAVYKIPRDTDSIYFFKCDSCYEKNRTLRNWRDCEVYSRVVGYLRPVQQYNKGKREEVKMRKMFKNTAGK